MEKPKTPMPRDMAGSMTFEGGTGGILRMVSFTGFLEAYKVDATNRVYTPDHVDPDRTNPNAPWSTTYVPVGCGNPIIARIVVQSLDMLNMVIHDRTIRADFLMHLWKLKEALLACEVVANDIVPKILGKCDEVKAMRINPAQRAWNPKPSVDGLQLAAQTFLNNANRAVRLIASMPRFVMPLSKPHMNFDVLATDIEKLVPADSELLAFVKRYSDFIRRIAVMRNFEEHENDSGPKTVINDFVIRPDGISLTVPEWGMEGEKLVSIVDEIPQMMDYLLGIGEEMFLRLVIFQTEKESMPISITQIDPLSETCPMQFRMNYHWSPPEVNPPPSAG